MKTDDYYEIKDQKEYDVITNSKGPNDINLGEPIYLKTEYKCSKGTEFYCLVHNKWHIND